MEHRRGKRRVFQGACCWLLLIWETPLVLAAGPDRRIDTGERGLAVALAGLLFLTVILAIRLLRERNLRRTAEKDRHRVERFHQIQQAHYRKVLARQKQLRIYRHDMVNHIMAIQRLLELGQHERLKTYLQEMEDPAAEGVALVTTGNLTADALLTEKRTQAKEANVWLEDCLLLDVEPDPPIAFFDLFLNVGLSHAIEVASRQTGPRKNRWVDLELTQKQGGLLGTLRYAAQEPKGAANQSLGPLLRSVEESGGVWNLTEKAHSISLQVSLPSVRPGGREGGASGQTQSTVAESIGVDAYGEGDTL